MIHRRTVLHKTAAVLSSAAVLPLWGQTNAKALRVVVPFPPGGVTDVLARLIADKMRGVYAPSVLVDNRPGAAGRIAVEYVKAGEADGNLVLFTPDFLMTVYPPQLSKTVLRPAA